MTTATVKEELDIERLHPILSNRWQAEAAGKELTDFEEQERNLTAERLQLIQGTESPRTQTRLNEIEGEILRLQTLQLRSQDKIEALKQELPKLRKEAEAKLEELIKLEARGEELAEDVKSLSYDIWKICDNSLVHRLRGLLSKRERVVEDLRKLPYLIRDVKSFFHLEPGVKPVEIPVLDQKVVDLGEALLKK